MKHNHLLRLAAITTLTIGVTMLPAACAQSPNQAHTQTNALAQSQTSNQQVRIAMANDVPSGPVTTLAHNGQAKMTVVVAPDADKTVREAADRLADYLSRISGAKFTVEQGDGATGIAVGLRDSFPALAKNKKLGLNRLQGDGTRTLDGIATLQSYILNSHPKGIYVLGASDIAVKYAVSGLLYRLGYRHFFQGKTWEVIPNKPNLAIHVDTYQKPDFVDRRIGFSYGGNGEAQRAWIRDNRMTRHSRGALRFNNVQGYGGFLSHAKRDGLFKKHPEYLALVKGKRTRRGGKLSLSNPELRKLMAQYAVDYFKKYPDRMSISMEPPDGTGWDESAASKAMGNKATQLVILANEVQAALDKHYNGKKHVAILAYFKHHGPPTVKVDPGVNVAMAPFGPPIEKLLPAWDKYASNMGVYDFLSIFSWTQALPGKVKASSPEYVAHHFPWLYAHKVRSYYGEAGEAWGQSGLGYYLASRVFWDVDQAKHTKELVNDFLTKSFGPAAESMRGFYQAIDRVHGHTSGGGGEEYFQSLVDQMSSALVKARQQAKSNPKAMARLNDLALYTHYCQLNINWRWKAKSKTEAQKQKAVEEFVRFAHGIRNTYMAQWRAVQNGGVRGIKQHAIIKKLGLKDLGERNSPPPVDPKLIQKAWQVAAQHSAAPTGTKTDEADHTSHWIAADSDRKWPLAYSGQINSGNFGNTNHWEPRKIPGASADVIFNHRWPTPPYTVKLKADQVVNGFNIKNDNVTLDVGSSTLTYGTRDGSFLVAADKGSLAASLTVTSSDAKNPGKLTGSGALKVAVARDVHGSLTVTNGATFAHSGKGTVLIGYGGSNNSLGKLTVTKGGVVDLNGDVRFGRNAVADVNVNSGGQLNTGKVLLINGGSNAVHFVIDGAKDGATWNAGSILFGGPDCCQHAATANILVKNGGVVKTPNGRYQYDGHGARAASHKTIHVTVTGAGSLNQSKHYDLGGGQDGAMESNDDVIVADGGILRVLEYLKIWGGADNAEGPNKKTGKTHYGDGTFGDPGTVTLKSGSIEVAGKGKVIIRGRLRGNGTIRRQADTGGQAITVVIQGGGLLTNPKKGWVREQVNGTLQPGDLADKTHGIGTISIKGGNVIFDQGTYDVDLKAAKSDQVNIAGNLDLTKSGDTIRFNPLSKLTAPKYTLATFHSFTAGGKFDNVKNLPKGYQIKYNPTSITLSRVSGK